MGSTRKKYDPLATSPDPRWLKVLDGQQKELSSQRIAPNADLRSVMNQEAEKWASRGWTVERNGEWGVFFIRRGADRWLVMLTPAEHASAQHQNPRVK